MRPQLFSNKIFWLSCFIYSPSFSTTGHRALASGFMTSLPPKNNSTNGNDYFQLSSGPIPLPSPPLSRLCLALLGQHPCSFLFLAPSSTDFPLLYIFFIFESHLQFCEYFGVKVDFHSSSLAPTGISTVSHSNICGMKWESRRDVKFITRHPTRKVLIHQSLNMVNYRP